MDLRDNLQWSNFKRRTLTVFSPPPLFQISSELWVFFFLIVMFYILITRLNIKISKRRTKKKENKIIYMLLVHQSLIVCQFTLILKLTSLRLNYRSQTRYVVRSSDGDNTRGLGVILTINTNCIIHGLRLRIELSINIAVFLSIGIVVNHVFSFFYCLEPFPLKKWPCCYARCRIERPVVLSGAPPHPLSGRPPSIARISR